MEGSTGRDEQGPRESTDRYLSPGDTLGPLLTPNLRMYVGVRQPLRVDTLVFRSA
jgi:hypothetical protein